MESTPSDASKFLRGGIYDTQEEALLGVLKTPIKKSKPEEQSGSDIQAANNFIKGFFPGIEKPL
ncbi:MAG: hypothetical protein WAZ12_01330 [Candidatus Absconditicoccaceae bacterium]